MKIGNVEIPSPIFLAPMAGVTDFVFRKICKEHGAGLVVTEMVSAKAMAFGSNKTLELMATDDYERPAAVQIFGSEPDCMGQMAAMLDNSSFDIIDINMGCPAPKIVKNGDGSALMRDPILIGKIIRAVIANTNKPVTCKIRLGYTYEDRNYLEVAKVAEDSGIAAITVHGRTRPQMYSGQADWDAIAAVKAAAGVPVIGNGDIASPEDAKKRLDESLVDAVMIGRAAFGNPWLFRRCSHYIACGELLPEPCIMERIDMAMHHAQSLIAHKGEHIAIREMRKHIAWYIKGVKGGAVARDEVNKANSFEEIKAILLRLKT